MIATRNVVLTQHLRELVDELIKSGRHQNASEVLRAGLRLVEDQEQEREACAITLWLATRETRPRPHGARSGATGALDEST